MIWSDRKGEREGGRERQRQRETERERECVVSTHWTGKILAPRVMGKKIWREWR